MNVTLPVRLSDQGFGIYGIIQANKTSGMYVTGNASITLQIRDPDLDRFKTPPLIEITRNIQAVICIFGRLNSLPFSLLERLIFSLQWMN